MTYFADVLFILVDFPFNFRSPYLNFINLPIETIPGNNNITNLAPAQIKLKKKDKKNLNTRSESILSECMWAAFACVLVTILPCFGKTTTCHPARAHCIQSCQQQVVPFYIRHVRTHTHHAYINIHECGCWHFEKFTRSLKSTKTMKHKYKKCKYYFGFQYWKSFSQVKQQHWVDCGFLYICM